MANEVAESKTDAPGSRVTVCLPALIRSASSSPSRGNGPMPRMPFSLCKVTRTPGGRWFPTRVGMPMPRFTYCPSSSSSAAIEAMSSRLHTGAHRPFLDVLRRDLDPDEVLDEDPRGVDVVGREVGVGQDLLRLRDGHSPGHGDEGVEVARGQPIAQVALLVGAMGADEGQVGADAALEDGAHAVELHLRLA